MKILIKRMISCLGEAIMSISEEEARMEEGFLEGIDNIFIEMTGMHLRKQLEDYLPKIKQAKKDAIKQGDSQNYNISLILSCVALEIFVKQIIIKPLAQGAFYYEEWADLLANKVGSGNAGNDREIFCKVLKTIKYDVNSIKIKEKTFSDSWKHGADLRNRVMHEYIEISKADAEMAIMCVGILFDKVLPFLLDYYHIREKEENIYEWYYK